jgi:hypothetical protein
MSELQKSPQPAAAKIKVKLKQKHTHAGIEHEAGMEIEVTPAQAEWLKAQGVV